MRDRNKEGMQDDQSSMNNENESSRRPDSGGFGSATGRTGSFGNRGGGGSDVSRDELDRSQGSSIDRESDPSSNRNEGRH